MTNDVIIFTQARKHKHTNYATQIWITNILVKGQLNLLKVVGAQ